MLSLRDWRVRQGSSPVSDYALQDLGEGRFAVAGEMSFNTADQLLRSSDSLFRQHQSLQVDMSAVSKADSAGLALLLEWKARAAQRNAEIRFEAIPDSLQAIAITTEVSDLL